MANRASVVNYFQKKRTLWITHDGSVDNHVNRLREQGLADEFNGDRPEFNQVCEYARYLSTVQTSNLPEKMEDLLGEVLGFPLEPSIDIMLGGIDIACGHKKTGTNLVKAGLGVLAIVGLGYLLNSIFGKKKS